MSTTIQANIKMMSLQLLVTDIDHSIDFYEKQLGFKTDFRYEDFYCGINKDGFTIHLKLGKPSAEERKNRRTNENLDIVFYVDNIEELYQEILSGSVEITQQLRTMSYGKEFYIADPDGYLLGFLEMQ